MGLLRLGASATLAISLGLVGPANAAKPIATPPLFVPSGNVFTCTITNLGTKPATFELARLGASGATVGVVRTLSLAPGESASNALSGVGVGGWMYCRVTGPSSRNARATACVSATAGTACASGTTAP